MSEQEKFTRVLSIILADASFESPNKLALQELKEVPSITQTCDGPYFTEINKEEGVFMVRLKVTVSCDYNDTTNVFIAQTEHRATVVVPNQEEFSSQLFLKGTTVDLVYNEARSLINELITSAGFPEFHLQFLSFEQRFLLENQEKLVAANQNN